MRINHDNEFISFIHIGPSPSGKTHLWSVRSKSSGDILGQIRWYGAWRQYCFYPEGDTIWNEDCLRAVRNAMNQANEDHKKGLHHV